MTPGKNALDKYREMLEDDKVPMKTKVSMGGAMQADTHEAVGDIKATLDLLVTDVSTRLLIVETKDEKRDDEIQKLQSRSDRNDIISVTLIAIGTFFGIKQ